MVPRYIGGLFYFCKVEKKFTLGKDERLKSRKQIDELFAKGHKISTILFRAKYLLHTTVSVPLQFGVSVSKRDFKKAVDRNRIKRLTREAWRLQNTDLKDQLTASGKQMSIFLIYTGATMPTSDNVFEAVKKMIDRFPKIIAEPI